MSNLNQEVSLNMFPLSDIYTFDVLLERLNSMENIQASSNLKISYREKWLKDVKFVSEIAYACTYAYYHGVKAAVKVDGSNIWRRIL